MIFDKLENLSQYAGLHPHIAQALQHLQHLEHDTLQIGRHEIKGDDIFLMSQCNQLAQNSGRYEYHKGYADIHIVREGAEKIAYGFGKLSTLQSFNDEEDFGLVSCSQHENLILSPGYFALFLPGEPHHPNIAFSDASTVKKWVLKVLIS